jgi:hypothetical protein
MCMNIEQVPKPSIADADPASTWGRLSGRTKRAKHAVRPSAGALMTACLQEEFCCNTGSPNQCWRHWAPQPVTREGQTGLAGMTDRPVVLRKPGNAGGGKGP